MQASEQTGGIFDVTCAPLINLWGFGFTKFDSITPQLVDSIRHFVGFRKVHLQGNRVMKDDPRILLNFSVLGGEMIAKGKNPQGWNWCIGIVRPKDDSTGTNSELEQIVQLSERLGLATSGNYRNFYLKDGRKYAHAINPITGYPVQKDILSATIIAHQCMLADAYATAFMTLGSRKARQL
ncbi:FAD:protein FMN transferase [Bacteroides stercoris]|mgnify:CR=1 FL=1|jgi:thiamine biosynthesis lipoprotein ApbE|uniref:FAD:protein FMN transferase n=1 Tax=Bacteroides stercoris TaxID=46506 RepID=UPI00234CF509|nr:FAD:protein FMN transferase [Bacteroides stercoris]MDC7163006.1 FAD:protein FMN transferase [Bacteroides stercoris]MDC7168092.1 FAD:protein FMN transferase [Bacteroides stercoris]